MVVVNIVESFVFIFVVFWLYSLFLLIMGEKGGDCYFVRGSGGIILVCFEKVKCKGLCF